MSPPMVVRGQYFDVAVEADPVGAPGIYTLICGLNTRNLTHQINTSDDAIRNCQDPEQIPWRVLNATSQQKDMSGTGLYNRAQGLLIRTIYGKTLNYRFIESEPGNDAIFQGYWQGPFKFTNWQEGASDGGNVTAQFTFASDGEVPWVASTAEILVALTLTPLTATATTLWTGTIGAKTAGSTITATTTGGVMLTVNPAGTSVTGTWPTTGSKVVTLTETFAEASNSPLVTTKTVVVS